MYNHTYAVSGHPVKQINRIEVRKAASLKRLRTFILIMVMAVCFAFGAIVHAYAAGSGAAVQAGGTSAGGANPAASAAGSTSASGRHFAASRYIVDRGDTLWSIAERHAPAHVSIQEYIGQIRSLNHMHSSLIHEGDELVLPK